MRLMFVAIAVFVSIVLLGAYLALSTESVDDFEDNVPDSDGDGVKNDYSWYAVFTVNCQIVSSDSLNVAVYPFDGEVTSITCDLQRFISLDTGRVYQGSDLLRGGGGGQAFGEYWFTIDVTGPASYKSAWTGGKGSIIAHDPADPQIVSLTTGRCLFQESGTYTVTVTFHALEYLSSDRYDLDVETKSFEVS